MTHITIYTHMKLFPKCHPYWEVDGKTIQNDQVQALSYTSQGYLLPCCWCDAIDPTDVKQYENYGLFKLNLKVSNVDNIEEDILKSSEWYHFHETVLTNPTAAPDICKKKCNKNETIL